MNSFWQILNKPWVGLSPMDGITDTICRFIQAKYGQPDLIYTEFTSVEGVCHGATRLLKDFLYDETQRPIVAQLFGTTPDYFRQVAVVVCELGFDGIDLNMGCPAKSVTDHGAGAALIKNPQLAQDIVRATQQGVQDFLNGQRSKDCPDISDKIWTEVARRAQQVQQLAPTSRSSIPVSIKTRLGYDQIVTTTWIPTLLATQPAAIAIHGRTLHQSYGGQANWDEIAIAAKLIHQTDTLAIGNGDINNRAEAEQKAIQYGVDGVLIGRAALSNPYVFQKINPSDKKNIFAIALEHAQLYEATYQHEPKYSFLPMRKHLGWYVKNIPQAKQVRMALLQTNSSQEVKQIFNQFRLLE